jgi:hypothetical protein
MGNKDITAQAKRKIMRVGAETIVPELMDIVCEAIATSQENLDKLCKNMKKLYPEFPASDTIYRWILKYPDFAEKYRTARRAQAQLFVDQIVEISDECDDKEVAKATLRVNTRKWLASRLLIDYADKQQLEHSVTVTHEALLIEAEKISTRKE